MLEKILLVGVFIMTTLSANANELEEPVVSSKLSAMQESADTYAPGCDDSYRGVYPPHYPPHYPPQFPRPRPPQNSKKFCKQFKRTSTLAQGIPERETFVTGTTTTTNVENVSDKPAARE